MYLTGLFTETESVFVCSCRPPVDFLLVVMVSHCHETSRALSFAKTCHSENFGFCEDFVQTCAQITLFFPCFFSLHFFLCSSEQFKDMNRIGG